MGDITHATPCPVSQRKERFSAQVISLLDQIAQDKPLIWFKDARSKLLLCLNLDPTGRISFQGFLFVNQPLTKVFDDGLDTGAMTHAISLFFEPRQISFYDRHRKLVGLKVFPMSWAFGDPLSELMQDAQICINRCFVEFCETCLVVAFDPLLIAKLRKGNNVGWFRHFLSFPPTKFSAASFALSFLAASSKYAPLERVDERKWMFLKRHLNHQLTAESIFCCEFSATSQSTSKRERMQVERDLSGICSWLDWKQPGGYFALHVSFAHITPRRVFTNRPK